MLNDRREPALCEVEIPQLVLQTRWGPFERRANEGPREDVCFLRVQPTEREPESLNQAIKLTS